jgi:hypothetical protein
LCHRARPLATAFGIYDRGFVQPGMATLSSSILIPCSRSRKRRHDEALLKKGTPSHPRRRLPCHLSNLVVARGGRRAQPAPGPTPEPSDLTSVSMRFSSLGGGGNFKRSLRGEFQMIFDTVASSKHSSFLIWPGCGPIVPLDRCAGGEAGISDHVWSLEEIAGLAQ